LHNALLHLSLALHHVDVVHLRAIVRGVNRTLGLPLSNLVVVWIWLRLVVDERRHAVWWQLIVPRAITVVPT